MPAPKKQRLDQALVARGLADSRSRAQADIMAGRVRVGGVPATKAGTPVSEEADIQVEAPAPFVSRGGLKLAAALSAFDIDPTGLICLDAGASTGGFTDCLLQGGAAHVFAVDVGKGQLLPKIADDPRVTVMDRTNVRHLTPRDLPGPPDMPIDLVVADLSFISLTLVLPALAGVLKPGGVMILLVKPQFEVGKEHVGKGGIVKDPALHEAAVQQVVEAAKPLGLFLKGRTVSPIKGAKGNTEFLILLGGPEG